jgi:hypothetical protein
MNKKTIIRSLVIIVIVIVAGLFIFRGNTVKYAIVFFDMEGERSGTALGGMQLFVDEIHRTQSPPTPLVEGGVFNI